MRVLLASVVTSLLAASAHAGVFISADEAKGLVGKDNVRFVFADSDKYFAKGHIPGSVEAYANDLTLLDDVRACSGLPMCEAKAATFIGKLGIDAATQVIVYDGGPGANDSGAWFFLTLYGHDNVSEFSTVDMKEATAMACEARKASLEAA